jgi:1-acyl-sn-glycerol-3-phosphate acyltransferase
MLRTFYKIYFRLVVMPVFAIITILTAIIVAAGCILGGEKFFAYYPGMLWARIACILTLCPVKVKGRENIKKGQSYVFVSNHQGAYDIFLIYGYLGVPIKWMMKKGLAKIPLVGFACRMAGFTFVDNSSARSAQKSVQDAERRLKRGHSLIVFPEGSRSLNGHLKRFKRGAYQIAVDQQLSIIPITLNGPYKVMPAGSRNVRPHRMEMIIHAPVLPHKKELDDKEKLQKLVDTTQKTISSALWEEFK